MGGSVEAPDRAARILQCIGIGIAHILQIAHPPPLRATPSSGGRFADAVQAGLTTLTELVEVLAGAVDEAAAFRRAELVKIKARAWMHLLHSVGQKLVEILICPIDAATTPTELVEILGTIEAPSTPTELVETWHVPLIQRPHSTGQNWSKS
jgi:hypothetical protein